MGFGDDNSSAVNAFTAANAARNNFLLNLAMQRVQYPQIAAQTGLTQAETAAKTAEAKRQQQLFDLTFPRLKRQADIWNAAGQITPPTAPASDASAGTPDVGAGADSGAVPFGPVKPGLAVVPPGGAPTPALTTPPANAPSAPGGMFEMDGRKYQYRLNKEGAMELVDQTGGTQDIVNFINQHPDQIAKLPPDLQEAAQKQLSAVGSSIGNTKASAEAEQALLTAAYGTPEERKAHSEFSRNAAQLSRRLNEYRDTVQKVGNYEWWDPEGAAKLSSLPLDISDNWTKVTNPGGVLREGLVDLGKELQIPTANEHWYGAVGLGPKNDTTLAAIDQTKKVLADYVRQYENLPYTKAPVFGLTPELRQMVGETTASKNFKQMFGSEVPTDMGNFAASPTAAKVTPPGATRVGDSSTPATVSDENLPVVSPDKVAKLEPGTRYKGTDGVIRVRGGARPVANLGSNAGASRDDKSGLPLITKPFIPGVTPPGQ